MGIGEDLTILTVVVGSVVALIGFGYVELFGGENPITWFEEMWNNVWNQGHTGPPDTYTQNLICQELKDGKVTIDALWVGKYFGLTPAEWNGQDDDMERKMHFLSIIAENCGLVSGWNPDTWRYAGRVV